MKICLSKRPGLRSAGSRISGLLVPAKTTTFVVVLKPVNEFLVVIDYCKYIIFQNRPINYVLTLDYSEKP